MGSIFLIIWVIKPLGRPGLDLSLRILLSVLLLGSPWLHHDSRQRLGLRFDTFPRAAMRRWVNSPSPDQADLSSSIQSWYAQPVVNRHWSK